MATECSAFVEILKTLIPTIAVVSGWVVVHKLSVTRDRENARRKMLVDVSDSIIKNIDAIFICSKNYHSTLRDENIEITLKMSLQDLSYQITQLVDIAMNDNEIKPCRNAMLEMKKAITIKHFEDEHNGPIDQKSPQIQTIAYTVLKLKQTFLKLKHSQFSIKNNTI